MSFFVPGNPPITSTAASQTNPSTAVLLAELDSTALHTATAGRTRLHQVNLWCGGSTTLEWWFEHCTSTGLGSSAITERQVFRTAANQTSQFVRKVSLSNNERLRVRISAALTGSAEAKLQAEALE